MRCPLHKNIRFIAVHIMALGLELVNCLGVGEMDGLNMDGLIYGIFAGAISVIF